MRSSTLLSCNIYDRKKVERLFPCLSDCIKTVQISSTTGRVTMNIDNKDLYTRIQKEIKYQSS